MSYYNSTQPEAESYASEGDVEGEEATHGQTPRIYLPEVEDDSPQPAEVAQHDGGVDYDPFESQHRPMDSQSGSSAEPQPQAGAHARPTPAPLNAPVIRRSSGAVGVRGSTPGGHSPRSTSVLSTGSPKDDLRRRSLVDHARYQNERRASSIANTLAAPTSERRSSRMTPSEAFAVEQIAYNDMRRQEVKERADEIEADREAIVIEAEMEKEKMLYERGMTRAIAQEEQIQQRAIERQNRTEAAAARRAQQEAERIAALEEKLDAKMEKAPDAYKVLEAKRRYSTQEAVGGSPDNRRTSQGGPRRSSQAGVIAPRRSSGARQDGEVGPVVDDGDRRASQTAKQMWGRRSSAASHERQWH